MGIATVTAIVGAGVSVYKTIDEAKKKKKAAAALEALDQPELKNVAEDLRVSTASADLQREEQARLASTQVDALKESGTRGIVGGLGRVEDGSQRLNREIGADLDKQQIDNDRLVATDNVELRKTRETRHSANVSALSSQYNAAAQAQNTAMGNAITSAGTAANAYMNSRGVPQEEDTTDKTSSSYKPPVKAKAGDRRDTRFDDINN